MTMEHDVSSRASAHTAVVKLDPIRTSRVVARLTRWSVRPVWRSASAREPLDRWSVLLRSSSTVRPTDHHADLCLSSVHDLVGRRSTDVVPALLSQL